LRECNPLSKGVDQQVRMLAVPARRDAQPRLRNLQKTPYLDVHQIINNPAT
jgi:hypothetical protein